MYSDNFWDTGFDSIENDFQCCSEPNLDIDRNFSSCGTAGQGADPYISATSDGSDNWASDGVLFPMSVKLRNIPDTPGSSFYYGDVGYSCEATNGQDGCLYDNSAGSIITPRVLTQSEVDSENYTCLDVGEPLPDNEDLLCGGGEETIDAEALEGITIEGIRACQSLSSIGEQQDCEDCFALNNENNNSNFIYTALGCVDVSRDGLITRIFQIGVGMIGGFAIWRLVQAAFKMQNKDPAEMQEARENTLSALWAILLLVGAVTILRFIGVDVLGIVSSAFLN